MDDDAKIRFYQGRDRKISEARTYGEIASMITETRVDDPDGLPAMIVRWAKIIPLAEVQAMATGDPWLVAIRHGAEPIGQVGQEVRVDRAVHDPMSGAGTHGEVVREGIVYGPERLVIAKARVY